MKSTQALLLSLLVLAACGKKEKSPTTADTGATAKEPAKVEEPKEPVVEEPAVGCQKEQTMARLQALENTLAAYASLGLPTADSDCEALRLLTVKLAPLARSFSAQMNELKEVTQKQADECRPFNRANFGTRMAKVMTDGQKTVGPAMEAFQLAARPCKGHPGLAEAFRAALPPPAE